MNAPRKADNNLKLKITAKEINGENKEILKPLKNSNKLRKGRKLQLGKVPTCIDLHKYKKNLVLAKFIDKKSYKQTKRVESMPSLETIPATLDVKKLNASKVNPFQAIYYNTNNRNCKKLAQYYTGNIPSINQFMSARTSLETTRILPKISNCNP